MGIEPTYEAWEASILPLNYTRDDKIDLNELRPFPDLRYFSLFNASVLFGRVSLYISSYSGLIFPCSYNLRAISSHEPV